MLINDVYAETNTIATQENVDLPPSPASITNSWTSLVPMILIFAVFYFLLIRPQEKRRRAQQNLTASMKKGEEVLTNSGMIGIVSKINDSDNVVFIEVAKAIEIKMLKTSVTEILSRNKKDETNNEKSLEKKTINKEKKEKNKVNIQKN